MPPTGVLWPLEAHTAAKHQILKRYLQAWIPILATHHPALCLIDGFAGPGRYEGGEPGSPLVMLDAYLSHSDKARITAASELRWIFIEKDERRARHLSEEVDRVRAALPARWRAEVLHADFGDAAGPVIDGLGNARTPTFLFIDPFGYTETRPELSARILNYPHCEVLVFLPMPFVARFIDDTALAPVFDNLFDGPSWLPAREMAGLAERKQFLHDRFVDRLRQSAEYVRSFEIESTPTSGYHLFFATNNLLGLQKMKEAMWTVDPEGGSRFADSTIPGQSVLFQEAGDLRMLERQLRARFAPRQWFTIEEAERFTLVETAYLPTHLRSQTLVALEESDQLFLLRGGTNRPFTYPPGTEISFRS